MFLADLARKFLPAETVAKIAHARRRYRRARIEKLPALGEKRFIEILSDQLGLKSGSTVYVGSSLGTLHLGFPFSRIRPLIRSVIGPKGTMVFPTYPNRGSVSSYQWLSDGNVFDIKRTPSYTGIVSEFARRQKNAVRSLHPTKSVVAIGPNAIDLTRSHQDSPYPYDTCSPYYKLVEYEATVIGIGISTEYMSFGYTVDDAQKENPPVRLYHPRAFKAKCINYAGEAVTVETYAHDMTKCVHPDVPAWMGEHIAPEICEDLTIDGMRFFRADAKQLFVQMLRLAKRGITIYPRRLYSEEFLQTLGEPR